MAAISPERVGRRNSGQIAFHSFTAKLINSALSGLPRGTGRAARAVSRKALKLMSNEGVALGSILTHHARRSPSGAALILGDVRVGYGELVQSILPR